VTLLLSNCSASNFAGAGAKNSKASSDNPSKKGGGADDENGDSANQNKKPGSSNGDDETIVNVGDAYKDGILKEDCKQSFTLPSAPTELTQVFNWQASGATAEYNQVMATPVLGKLGAGDSAPTIVTPAFSSNCNYSSGGAYLYAIDGKTGAQKWVAAPKVLPSASAALGDIDGDGTAEVVAFGLDGRVYAFSATGTQKWMSADAVIYVSSYYSTGPTVADLDGDGTVEVLAVNRILKGSDGTSKVTLAGFVNSTSNPIAANADGMGGLEVIASNGIYKSDGTLLCAFTTVIDMFASARLRPGDSFETIIGRSGDQVIGYNGQSCAQVFSVAFPGTGGGPYNVGDYTGSGELKFGAAGKVNFAAFNGDGSSLWQKPTKDASSAKTGATTFDFNGDGKYEIVYNDEDYLRIYDGASGSVLYQMPNSSGTLWEYPVIADVDGDGHANIVVHANDCFDYTNRSARGIRVFQAPDNSWVGTRSIWNQHAYNPLLVKSNGGLTGIDPDTIWKPWLKAKYLTGFRNNIPMPKIKAECNP